MTERPDAIDDLICDFGTYLAANMLDGCVAGRITMDAHSLVGEVLELLHDYLRDRAQSGCGLMAGDGPS
mgnify:CR=1 FL=1